jgi:hypothetical protein
LANGVEVNLGGAHHNVVFQGQLPAEVDLGNTLKVTELKDFAAEFPATGDGFSQEQGAVGSHIYPVFAPEDGSLVGYQGVLDVAQNGIFFHIELKLQGGPGFHLEDALVRLVLKD